MCAAVVLALIAVLVAWQPVDLETVCDGARTCGEMESCSQAYACWLEGNKRLDRDNDCIPCEGICKE